MKDKDIKETDYKPEIIISVASIIGHMIIAMVVVFGVVELYELSSSWHSLWLILILSFSKSYSFTREQQPEE